MFNQQDLEARIQEANAEMVTGEEEPNAPAAPQAKGKIPWFPIDLYRNTQRKLRANARKEFPKGSRMLVMAATKDVIDGEGGLALAKRRAENDSDSLAANGYKDRAELMKQQYMQEKFLPAVEVVVECSSPDELLNCKDALRAFDKMALGVGSMSGYTASYIRQAYGNVLGQNRGESDPGVASEILRIKNLVNDDQIRTAIGMAKKLKERVDDGEAMASPEDYAIIGRIVSYAN